MKSITLTGKEISSTKNYIPFNLNFQTLITIAYVFAIGIGMLFTYRKYKEFGINIFDYADVFHFLIAPFSDYRILLFTLVSLIFSFVMYRLDLFWKDKFPKLYSWISFGQNNKSWFGLFRLVTICLVFLVYLDFSATIYGKHTSSRIRRQNSINLKFTDNENLKGIFIGKTKEIIFLLDQGVVKAIPISHSLKEYNIN